MIILERHILKGGDITILVDDRARVSAKRWSLLEEIVHVSKMIVSSLDSNTRASLCLSLHVYRHLSSHVHVDTCCSAHTISLLPIPSFSSLLIPKHPSPQRIVSSRYHSAARYPIRRSRPLAQLFNGSIEDDDHHRTLRADHRY